MFTHLFGISKQYFPQSDAYKIVVVSEKEIVVPLNFQLPMAFRSFGWDMNLSWDTDLNLRLWALKFIHSLTQLVIQQISISTS